MLPTASLRRISSLILRLDVLDRPNQYLVLSKMLIQCHFQIWNSLLFHFKPILTFLSKGQPKVSRKVSLDQVLQEVSPVSVLVQDFRVEDWVLHAYIKFSNRLKHKQAWHWIHLRMFSTTWCCIFFYLDIESDTLVVKPVNAVNARTLMVASQHEEILRIFNFIGHH